MEEDIKVLEEKLKQWEPYKNVKWSTPIEKEIARENQAIENLIARNKELERYRGLYENEMLGYMAGYEDGKHHRLSATAIVAEENKQKMLEQMLKQKYISKNRVREKIEEIEKFEVEHEMDFKAFYRIKDVKRIEIAVLQELLQEGDK